MLNMRKTMKSRRREGFTLVELMVSVAIVGILAAIAIPVFSRHVKEATISEATANIQGILEAQEAYFTRYHRYTSLLTNCPPAAAPVGENQAWVSTDCDIGWRQLGWEPEDNVYFQYRVFSLYDALGDTRNLPSTLPSPNAWGINWAVELPGNDPDVMEPWVAVEARADTDGDGAPVFFRGNSFNPVIFRCDQAGVPPPTADYTY